jgi:hypothetical protein
MTPRPREPIRFTRGRRLYQIAPAYLEGETGWIGLCDGRVVARAPERAAVAKALIGIRVSRKPNGRTTTSRERSATCHRES